MFCGGQSVSGALEIVHIFSDLIFLGISKQSEQFGASCKICVDVSI